MDSTPTQDTSLATMNRLQLQAACVKLGLDSTLENDLLRKQLSEHDGFMNLHGHVSSITATASTSITTLEPELSNISLPEAQDPDVTMDDVSGMEQSILTDNVKIEQEEEQSNTHQEQQEIPANNAEVQLETMAVEELSIKQEVLEEDTQEISPVQEDVMIEVKIEKLETEVVVKQETDTIENITIKQEKEEEGIMIKQEKTDVASISTDKVKKEDSPIPIAQRRQLWEARSTPSQQRSNLPLSRARMNTTAAAKRATTITAPNAQIQKRRRTADGEDDHDISMEEQSGSIPPSGTVKKLIGKFAGSSISAPNSPVGKKRRVDLPANNSSPGSGSNSNSSRTFPSIPKIKRVVKIPVVGNRAASSLYAMGNSAVRSNMRRKAASDSANGSGNTPDRASPGSISAAPTATTPKKTKPVSAETINRLATPKKINTGAIPNTAPVPAPNFGASTSTAPSTPTITKARGPVLSTAVRAAQRAKK
ncbi:hypothetical protein FBU30_001049 [Linnemannia zychae]|nr:hypothetical protein FBU30_001049 [Linnemannia zychae]